MVLVCGATWAVDCARAAGCELISCSHLIIIIINNVIIIIIIIIIITIVIIIILSLIHI